jgi:hypothetical protein
LTLYSCLPPSSPQSCAWSPSRRPSFRLPVPLLAYALGSLSSASLNLLLSRHKHCLLINPLISSGPCPRERGSQAA